MKNKLVINRDSKLFPLIVTLFAVSVSASLAGTYLTYLGTGLSSNYNMTEAVLANFTTTMLSATTAALIVSCIKNARRGAVYFILLLVGYLTSLAGRLYSYYEITMLHGTKMTAIYYVMQIVPLILGAGTLIVFALTVFGAIRTRIPAVVLFAVELGYNALIGIENMIGLSEGNSIANGAGGKQYIAGNIVSIFAAVSIAAYLLLMFTFRKKKTEE